MQMKLILLIQKLTPHCQTSYPDVLKTLVVLQQPTPKSGNLKWINNNVNQSEAMGIPRWVLGFPWLLGKSHFLFDGVKLSLAIGLMPSQWKK